EKFSRHETLPPLKPDQLEAPIWNFRSSFTRGGRFNLSFHKELLQLILLIRWKIQSEILGHLSQGVTAVAIANRNKP
ncbi:hypothetical protein MKW98_021778, partial [Papaver atlanticum]